MFPIDPRQAVLASASNTCTAGIMTLHFPSLALPSGQSRPARSPQSWMGQREAQYKLTPSKQPLLNSPHTPPGHFQRGEEQRGPTPSLPGSLSACKITPAPEAWGCREPSEWAQGVKLVPIPKRLFICEAGWKLKERGLDWSWARICLLCSTLSLEALCWSHRSQWYCRPWSLYTQAEYGLNTDRPQRPLCCFYLQ